MIPTPIRQVLFTIRKHQVRALLMGGQACVLYGAAQFSKDIDFVLLANDDNRHRLELALSELQANELPYPVSASRFSNEVMPFTFDVRHQALKDCVLM